MFHFISNICIRNPQLPNSTGSRVLFASIAWSRIRPEFLFSIYPWHEKKLGLSSEMCCHFLLQPKIQDGRHAPGMARLTFFIWEITSKFFFQSYSFYVLGMRWNHLKSCARGISTEFGDFHIFCGIYSIFINTWHNFRTNGDKNHGFGLYTHVFLYK